MWPTTAAAAGKRGDRGAGLYQRREDDRQRPLRDIERHHGNRAPRSGRAQHVGGAHVAAPGNPHVDTRAPGQEKRKGHRPREVPEQNLPHQDNGYRSRGS